MILPASEYNKPEVIEDTWEEMQSCKQEAQTFCSLASFKNCDKTLGKKKAFQTNAGKGYLIISTSCVTDCRQ